MNADLANFEGLKERPAIFSPARAKQMPPSEDYKVDWSELLKKNIQSQTFSFYIKSKQVLAGKMSTIDSTAEEFHWLAKQWKDETFFLSSLTKQFNHPAYIRIMAMGKEGLPLVLRELQNSQDNWFYALKFMAGRDVAAGIKDFETAKAAWLEWGYNQNYI